MEISNKRPTVTNTRKTILAIIFWVIASCTFAGLIVWLLKMFVL